MINKASDLDHAKRGVAVLALCIVRTLEDGDPTFRERFLKQLDVLYRDLRGFDENNVAGLELLHWVAHIVKTDSLEP